jgi:ComF family protein
MRDVVDFCYPGICALCKSSSPPGAMLCDVCFERLGILERAAACWQCAMPIAETGAPCPFCQGKGVPHYEHILRLGVFDEPLKDLIHNFKYQGRWAAGEFLAERLLEHERIKDLIQSADVLVPVPLHMFRHFRRGYNQATLIARHLARRLGKPLARPLSRVRHTPTQTNLRSRQKRFDNLRDAFRLRNSSCVKGKRVLVIDDVMTSGATLQTVARALTPAKPASLNALVLAVADPKGRDFQLL